MKNKLLLAIAAMGLGIGANANSNDFTTGCRGTCNSEYNNCMATLGRVNPFACGGEHLECIELCRISGH